MFAANRVIDVGRIVEVGGQTQGGAERDAIKAIRHPCETAHDATAIGSVRSIRAVSCLDCLCSL